MMGEVPKNPALWDLSVGRSFLLHTIVTAGFGSSGVGVDRGEVGASLVCSADSVSADKVVVTAENSRYGAGRGFSPEERAVTESFARSALARCAVHTAGETVHMDPSALAMVDLVSAQQRISDGTGVRVKLDTQLSRVVGTTWYGDILAVEAELTFVPVVTEVQRPEYQDHSPLNAPRNPFGTLLPGGTVTIRQQVALRPLPDQADLVPFDPRAGAMPDYSTHRFEDIAKEDAYRRLTGRLNLQQGPVVFYLDPAVPHPLRAAALEGGRWWQDAFREAGLVGQFRFEELPASADWRDPRLNIVLWVHRADRGWSYGMTHIDPRTGEIMRGVVLLGSQRVEEVRSIAEAVLAPYDPQHPRTEVVDEMVASRFRHLTAHETGHALGLSHNFASHHHQRFSVMDYPAPIFTLEGGVPLADAPYPSGCSPWDVAQLQLIYGRKAFSQVSEAKLQYLTDADARTHSTASALAATWVVPGEPVTGLEQVVAIRNAALKRFGPGVVPPGSDSQEMERRFAIVYLLHRHQAVYVAKQIGGTQRRYGPVTREFDGSAVVVPAKLQLAALAALAPLISAEFLRIPGHIRALLVPPGGGHVVRDGGFSHRTNGSFDVEEAVGAATDLVVSVLLAPERLNRVTQQHDDDGMGMAPLLEATLDHASETLNSEPDTTSRALAWSILDRFQQTAESPRLHRGTRAELLEHCEKILALSETSAARWRWEGLIRALSESSVSLPRAPLGSPI